MISLEICAGTSLYACSCMGLCAAGPELGRVAEQFGERHQHQDRLHAAAIVDALDAAAARGDVAHHVAHELLRRRDLELHHRLQERRVRLACGLLEPHRPRDLERHLGRVDLVVRPVDERRPHVHHRVTGQHTVVERLLDPLVDRRDVLARDRATRDLVDELVPTAGARGLQIQDHVGELAATAGLADEPRDDLVDLLADRLAVGHLGLADVRVHAELALQTVHQDVQMELTHPRDHRLTGLVVVLHDERRVLVGELGQSVAELVLVGLRLRLHGHRDDRDRERDRLEDDGVLGIADRVAGGGVLQADDRHDVARVRRFLVLAVVRVHLEDAADPLLAVLRRVHDVRPGLQDAGVDPQVREAADVRVGHDLERERRERLIVAGGPDDLLVLQRAGDERRHVERRRQVPDDRVEERLYALVLERRAAEHRHALVRERRTADRPAKLVDRGLLLVHELLHQGLVVVGESLEEVVTRGRRDLPVLLGDLDVLPLLAHLAFPHVALHLHQVDHPVEIGFGAPWELEDERRRLQTVDHHVDGALEVGARAIHLVHEADARDVVPVRLAPDRLGLRLDTGHRVEYRDGTVQDPERALDLDREVHVAGRVDDVDPMALPLAGGRGGRDRDAALALLDHPVHLRGALVHLTDLVGLAGVIEDALGRRGLAGVDVRHDPDVPGSGERVFADIQDLAGLPLDVVFRLCHLHLLRGARHLGDPPVIRNRPREAGPTFVVGHHR